MKDRTCNVRISFNCTTAPTDGWSSAPATSPCTAREFASSRRSCLLLFCARSPAERTTTTTPIVSLRTLFRVFVILMPYLYRIPLTAFALHAVKTLLPIIVLLVVLFLVFVLV